MVLTLPSSSSIQLIMKPEAQRRYEASEFVFEGQALARQGDEKGAIAAFEAALARDPAIDLDPETDTIDQDLKAVAQKFAARAKAAEKLALGQQLAQEGNAEKALQAYVEAEKLDPSLTDSSFWNHVGWWFSLDNHAAQALIASEKAVERAAGNPSLLSASRDTRGLARALAGDTKGAIEDFEMFIRLDMQPRLNAQRQQWVDALRKGQQPFTPQLLKKLRSE
jgi:tetratricopeptide (TPR) repeat protein